MNTLVIVMKDAIMTLQNFLHGLLNTSHNYLFFVYQVGIFPLHTNINVSRYLKFEDIDIKLIL